MKFTLNDVKIFEHSRLSKLFEKHPNPEITNFEMQLAKFAKNKRFGSLNHCHLKGKLIH